MFGIGKKNLIIFLFLLVLLIIIFYWQNIKEIVGPATEKIEKQSGENKELQVSGEPKPTETVQETPQLKLSREEFMDYVSKNISTLSPEKPVLGGRWYVIRFWFVKDTAAYIEYEDGHILRQILVEAKPGTEGKIDYKMVGYFEQGEGANEWILKSGDDPYFGKLWEGYEWDDISKSWRKR